MSTYLAAILGFFALLTPSIAPTVFSVRPPQLSQETQPPVTTPSNSPPDSGQSSSPAETAQPAATQSAPAPPPAPETQKSNSGEAAKNPASPAQAPAKKRRHRKTAANTSTTTPQKKIVRNGGTADPAVQLAPGISAAQASSQRQNVTQQLAATDANLKQIASRPMNPTQKESISQIRQYMEQAKAAEQAGDVERAQNLASKARLLSDDLVKH
ncbi:MAG: hypothetical protein WBQ68_16375 [Terriglobales bacterium]